MKNYREPFNDPWTPHREPLSSRAPYYEDYPPSATVTDEIRRVCGTCDFLCKGFFGGREYNLEKGVKKDEDALGICTNSNLNTSGIPCHPDNIACSQHRGCRVLKAFTIE